MRFVDTVLMAPVAIIKGGYDNLRITNHSQSTSKMIDRQVLSINSAIVVYKSTNK